MPPSGTACVTHDRRGLAFADKELPTGQPRAEHHPLSTQRPRFFFFLKTVGFQPSSSRQRGSQDSNPAKGAGRATLLLAASLLREEAVASRRRAAFPGDGGVLSELGAGAALCFGLNRSWARTGRGPPRRSQRGHFGTVRSDPRSSSRRDSQPWPTLRNKKRVPGSAAAVRSDLGYEKERRRGSASGAEGGEEGPRAQLGAVAASTPTLVTLTRATSLSRTQCEQSPRERSRWHPPASATVPQTQGTNGAHTCSSSRRLQEREKGSRIVARATQAHGARGAERGHTGHAPRPKHATPA